MHVTVCKHVMPIDVQSIKFVLVDVRTHIRAIHCMVHTGPTAAHCIGEPIRFQDGDVLLGNVVVFLDN